MINVGSPNHFLFFNEVVKLIPVTFQDEKSIFLRLDMSLNTPVNLPPTWDGSVYPDGMSYATNHPLTSVYFDFAVDEPSFQKATYKKYLDSNSPQAFLGRCLLGFQFLEPVPSISHEMILKRKREYLFQRKVFSLDIYQGFSNFINVLQLEFVVPMSGGISIAQHFSNY